MEVKERKSAISNSSSTTEPKRKTETTHEGTDTSNKLSTFSVVSLLGYYLKGLILILILCCGLSYLMTNTFTWGVNLKKYIPVRERIFTPEELKQYDGSDPTKPIYLAILGTVFDVSEGKSYYGKGGSYSFFSGRDASRAFITGCFQDHLTPDIRGLSEDQIKDLESWRDYYHKSDKYYYVGKVINPTFTDDDPIPEDCKNTDPVRRAYPERPGLGTSGRKVTVKVNTFAVTKFPQGDIYQYDLAIDPELPPKLNRKIFQALMEKHKTTTFSGIAVAFDGRKNLFMNKKLPQKSITIDLEYSGGKRPDNLKLTIKLAAQINCATLQEFLHGRLNYYPQDVIQALDVIARHDPAQKFVTVGPSFYTEQGAKQIGGGIDIWNGFFMSIRPGQGQLFANVDTAFTGFYRSGSVVEFLAETTGIPLRNGSCRPGDIRSLERAIKNLRVVVRHSKIPRKYKVLGLTETGAAETFFENEEGKKMSVAQYFKERYEWKFKFENLPCLRVGSAKRPVCIPMECCELESGQKYPKKLNDRQTSDMIKIACVKPHERTGKIADGLRMLTNPANGSTMKDFGLEIGQNIMNVSARVLDPPKVYYKGSDIQPRDGAWNMANRRFDKGSVLESFGIVNLGNIPRDQVENFTRTLVRSSRDYGVELRNERPQIFNIRPSHDMTRDFQQIFDDVSRDGPRCQLLFCLLGPQNNAQVYGEVKRLTDSVLGIPSQCVQAKNVSRCNPQLMANILLKVNAKLGGINSTLSNQMPFISEKPTIVFGADVTHPAPGGGPNKKPSIAAVVASMDHRLSRYASVVEVQNSREEIIVRLKDIVKTLLKNFYECTKCKPARILFYRDGVSDGQFAHVQDVEIAAIRKACSELGADYKPTITFVVVKKRHHIRLFPMSRDDGDRSGNVRAGTVVESAITHPRDFDFYLCSHSGIQGTSRPSHYYVVLDENKFTADSLQELTYRMCYTFVRCTRSVSVCPPAYYAHLVAFRARARSQYDDVSDTASVVSTGSNSSFSVPIVPPELSKTMYFV